MAIEHVAIWTVRLELLADFYARFFGARAGAVYRSERRPFESCFVSFESGARLELMRLPDLGPAGGPDPRVGLAHVAFSVGSRERVDRLTAELRAAGFTVVSDPRITGDGYYESVVLDPDGNELEIAG
ncbi:MAG TPA: VOC family protein [Anaeromyxobacter sp.]